MFNYIDNIIKNTYIKEHKKNYLNKKKCKITIVDNGIVLPVRKVNNQDLSQGAGGVIDSKLNYIKSSAMLAKNMKDRVNGKYNIDTDNIDYMDETVVYGNAFYKHWGHFLIDIVSRLWYLIDHPKYKVVFIVEESSDINIDGNYLELLELFGIKKENIIIVNKPTRFKKIIVPEVSIYPGKYYTDEYKKIFSHISSKVGKDENIPKKIYLSRSKFKKAADKEKGEKQIEEFFNNNGYTSIYPETLSPKEQISYYMNCEELVCINGTLSHNILFANDGVNVIIINKTYKMNKIQELINQIKKANVTYIDSHISLLPIAYGKGPFIISKTNNLKRFAKDHNLKWKKDYFNVIRKIYYKLWYLKEYRKKYGFHIYKDNKIVEEVTWKKLFKYYFFK